MKNKLLQGGIVLFVVGIVLMGTCIYIIYSNIKTTDSWYRAEDNLYKSNEIKVYDESLLILSHGKIEYYLVNSSYAYNVNSSIIINSSIPPIETTDKEAIYDLEPGTYTIFVKSNYTPHASISYVPIDTLIMYGVIVIVGLLFFLLGLIFIPMAIMSSRKNPR
ncbi:MAG: hypothetical protein JHC29_00860 [Thermoplasmata archaeon]|nr:hypothetical protein [Thermoplasmata archaeon]